MITNSNIKILLTISFVLICIYFLCKDNLEGFQIDVAGINVLCSSVGVDCNLPSNVAHVSGESGYTCVEPSEDIKALYKFDTATCTGQQTSSSADCATNATFIAEPIEANCPTDDGCVFSGTEETSFQSDSFNVNLITNSCAAQGAYKKGDINIPDTAPCSGPGQPYELSGCGFQCMKPASSGPEFEGDDFSWLGGDVDDFLGGSATITTSSENLHTKEFFIRKTPTTTGTGADQDVQDSRCARGYANASEICYGPDGEIAFKDDGKHIKTVDDCITYHATNNSSILCGGDDGNAPCPMFFGSRDAGDDERFVGLCYNADTDDEDKMPDNNSTGYKVLGCVETCESRNYKNQYYTYTPGGTIDSDLGLGNFHDGETQSGSGTRKHAELYQIQDDIATCTGTATNRQDTPDCAAAFASADDTTAESCPEGCSYESGIYSAIRSPYRMDEANLYPGQVKVKEMESGTPESPTPCHRKTIFYSESKLNPGSETDSLVMDNATALTDQDNKYQQGYQHQFSFDGHNMSYLTAPSYDYSSIQEETDDHLGVIEKCNSAVEDVADGEKLISFDTGYAPSDSGGTDHSRINIAGTGLAHQPRDEDGYSSSACEIGQTYSVSGLFPVCPEGEECLNFNLSYAHTDKYTGKGLSAAESSNKILSGIPYDLNKFKDEILGNRWLAGQLLNEGSPESISYTDEDIQNLQNSLYYVRLMGFK